VEHRVILEDELSRAKVPPNVRISYIACGHRKQADGKDRYENTAGIEELRHPLGRGRRRTVISLVDCHRLSQLAIIASWCLARV
jgi:hypothetical protein